MAMNHKTRLLHVSCCREGSDLGEHPSCAVQSSKAHVSFAACAWHEYLRMIAAFLESNGIGQGGCRSGVQKVLQTEGDQRDVNVQGTYYQTAQDSTVAL